MRKIAAYARALLIDLKSRLIRAGESVTKLDVGVDPLADRLDAAPAQWSVTKQIPRDIAKQVGFTIPAGVQKLDDVRRQGVHIPLTGIEGNGIGQSGIVDQRFMPKPDLSRGGKNPPTAIAEMVGEGGYRNRGKSLDDFRRRQAARS